MKKVEKEYVNEYGNIPRNDDTRFKELLYSMNLSKKSRKSIFERIQNILNIKWKRYDFIVYLVPKATPRPRHNIARNIFYVQGAKDNREIFKMFAKKHALEKISTPCKFTCLSYFPIPKSMNKVDTLLAEMGLIRPITKPDWDNVGKTYSDMIQEYLLVDDSLIIEGISKKFYSTKPRIEIHIEYMEMHDSLFNETKMKGKV